ncbi:MAG: heme-binding protein [Planctomycetes bacterium]|nr:heme-binding protein [Planctomycetota bacterium]
MSYAHQLSKTSLVALLAAACPIVAQQPSDTDVVEYTRQVATAHRAERLRLADELESTLDRSSTDDQRATIEQRISDLRFEPTQQAPLPVDWPPTSPVGEIVLKRYPKYRMATTSMSEGRETMPFWRLFGHIKSNDIAMTAPVQMDRASQPGDGERMAFLYREESLGPVGKQGDVEVIDVMPTLAISIGVRGYRSEKRVDELAAELRAWLDAHRDEFEGSGAVRVMGYNGPSVRGSRRFYEVEIPVRRVVHEERAAPASAVPTDSK